MQIVLASQSPYRRAQLEAFGLKFSTARPKVDEDSLKACGPKDLFALTRHLAMKKALSLAEPETLVIGGDQVAEGPQGQRLDKPGTFENALAQLLSLQGRTHRLITSLALIYNGETFLYTDTTEISLRELRREELEAYLKLDQPYDCAGSYKIERAGLSLVREVRGKDPSAIQGLPLIGLCEGFRHFKLPLWRTL